MPKAYGVENIPTITVKDGDKTLTEGTHYTVTITGDKKNVGNLAIFIKGINEYCLIEELRTYTIKAKNIAELTYEMSNREFFNGLPKMGIYGIMG